MAGDPTTPDEGRHDDRDGEADSPARWNRDEGSDGESHATNDGTGAFDRRRLLASLGATVGAGSVAGCSGIVDTLAGGAKKATKEFGPPPQAGLSREGVRALGPPRSEQIQYTTEEKRSVDDQKYLVTEHNALTIYGTVEEVQYPIGVLTTPKSKIDFERTNPLGRSTQAFVESQHSNEILNALGIDFDSKTLNVWNLAHVTDEYVDLEGTDVQVHEYVLNARKKGSDQTTEVVFVFCHKRTRGRGYLLLCTAMQAPEGEGVPQHRRDRTYDLLQRAAPEVKFDPSWPAPNFDLQIEDPRLVQTVEDTTVTDVGVDVGDPDLVEGENVAPVFDLGGFQDSPWYVMARVESEGGHVARANAREVPNPISGGDITRYDYLDEYEFDIRKEDLDRIRFVQDDEGQAPAVLQDASEELTWNPGVSDAGEWSLEPPVFELGSDHSALNIELMTPVGQSLDEVRLEKGTDFETASPRTIRVGFIPVFDPGRGANYGGATGFTDTYRWTVDAAVEYLYRVLPGGVIAYRHDAGSFKGHRKVFGTGEYLDFRRGRRYLEKAAFGNLSSGKNVPQGGKLYTRGTTPAPDDPVLQVIQNRGFDVWVVIVPRGYFDHHGQNATGLFPGKYSWAVGANEIDAQPSVADAVGTVAQEIGHYFQTDPYHRTNGPNGSGTYPLAQRDDRGIDEAGNVENGGYDLDHARHPDSNLIEGGETDVPGVVSRGYDLTDRKFRMVNGFDIDVDDFSTAPIESEGTLNTDRLPSYMSYADGETWVDSRIFQDAIDKDYGRHNWGNPEPVWAGAGRLDDDGTVRMVDVDAYRGRIPRNTWDGGTIKEESSAKEVKVALEAPNGKSVVSTVIKDRHHVSLHADETVEAVDLLVEFPTNTATVKMHREDVQTEINPITSVLRDVVERIPDRGFAGTPEEIRSQAESTIDNVAEEMAEEQFAAAKATLEEEFMGVASRGVRAEYDAYTGEPTREVVVDYTERMIDRLDVLAGEQQGQGLECGAELPREITEDTVLKEGCTYTIPDRRPLNFVDVRDGATLTVEPGVEVEVAADHGITVRGDSTLTARGTEDDPIEIYGSTERPGHWKGIEIYSDDPANELSYVTVAHAGDVYWESAVVMHRTDAAQATIRNCTIRESSTAGIRVDTRGGTLVDFRNNRIEDCEGPPLRLHSEVLTSLTGTTAFANNAQSHVLVDPELGDNAVKTDGTWLDVDIPYEFKRWIKITARIDVEEGATLQFRGDKKQRLAVDDGGRLVADASGGDPVTFRGAEDGRGTWRGIFLNTKTDNLLRNVVVSDGGGGYRNANVGVGIGDPGALTLEDSTISDSAGWGVRVTEDGTLTDSNNTFRNNAEGAIQRPDG